MNVLLIVVGLILFLMFIGTVFEFVSTQRDRQRYKTPPGKLVDVGGHKLHLLTMGERKSGQPVVVMEAGVASSSLDWQLVQPKVAEFAQTVTYDRAGYGWSEKGTDPRSPQQIATELHTLLHNAGVEPPYVLVGHSFGGIYIRLFVEAYPDEVAGLIFVESSVPSMIKTINTQPEIDRLKRVSRLKTIGLVRLMLSRILNHVNHLEGAARAQYFAFNMLNSDNVIREALPMYEGVTLKDAVDAPVIVISREPFEELASEQRWQEYQQELVKLSSDSRQIFASSNTHYPALSEPELVIRAIREILAQLNHKDN
jgi:pimeloyl-ACP methyl ester carboxylesterase